MALTAAQLNVIFSSKGADAVKGDLKDVESAIDTVGKTLAALGGGGTAALGLMTKSSMDFSAAMSNVNSIARVSDQELAALSDTILDLASAYSAAPTDLAEGLYDIIGSGFEDAAEAAEILEAAVVAAGAGMTDTATSTRAITAVLNAYGQEAEEAGNISDVLFKTVDSGVISFEELANNMGRVLPVASSLNVSIEELGAAFAELTLQGINASEAETAIAAMMTAALNPTEAMTAAIEEYGYASAEALIQTEGLAGYLEFLSQASGGTSEGMMALLGNVRALQGALVLTQGDGAGFNAMLETMGSAAQDGAYTLEVFGIQMDNAAGAVRDAQSEIGIAAINIGAAFEPMVQMGAQAVADLVGAFNGLPGPIQQTVAILAGLGSVSTLALGGFMLLIPKVLEFRNAMQTLGGIRGILAMVGGAFNPVTLGLGALTAAGVLAWSMFREGEDAAKRLEGAMLSLGDVAKNLRLSHLDEQADYVDNFARQVEEVQGASEAYYNSEVMLSNARKIAAESGRDEREVFNELLEAYRLAGDESDRLTKAIDAIGAAFADSRYDHEALAGALDTLHQQYLSGELTLDGYLNALELLVTGIDQYRAEADDATTATEQMGQAIETATTRVNAFNEGLNEAIASAIDDADGINTLEEALAALDEGFQEGTVSAEAFAEAKAELDRRMASGQIRSMEQYEEELIALANAHLEAADAMERMAAVDERVGASARREDRVEQLHAEREAMEARRDALAEWAEELERINQDALSGFFELTGDTDFTSQLNLTQAATDASVLAENLNDVAAALSNATRIAIQNTDAIGSQMQSLEDWALELINVKGEWGEIDDLLNEGRISLDQYNDAQQAQADITAANATVQRDLLAIQAMQAPILAESATAMADYVEQLRLMNDGTEEGARQQMAALALMDSTVQTQMQTLFDTYQLMGQLGPQGRDAFQQIIDGIVATDPYMTAVLEDLGLIERQLDGSYEINIDGFDQVASDIDNLNRTIADLIDIMDDGLLNQSYRANIDLDVEGQEDVADAKVLLDALDGRNVTATVGVSGAEGAKQALRDALGVLGGSDGGAGDGTGGPALTIPVNLQVPTDLPPLPEPEPLQIPVTFYASGAGDAIGSGTGWAAGALGSAFDSGLEIAASVTVDTSQVETAVSEVESAVSGIDGTSATVTIIGDNSDALTDVGWATSLDGQILATATVMIDGDNSDALTDVGWATSLDGVNLATAIVTVEGDNSHADGVIQAMGGYDGVVLATAYVDIVARQIGSGQAIASGIVAGARQGLGIHSPSREFAEIGKYTAMGFQQGWEREFENPSIGLSTAAAYSGYGVAASGTSSGSGVHIAPNAVNITVHAETGADADEIALAVADRITPALESALTQRRAGFGGVQA